MSKHRSKDYKISAVKYYLNNDVSLDDVCEIFDCPKQSLYRWFKRYNELEEIKRLNRKPKSYKITKEQVKYAIQKLKENEQITVEELHKIIKKKYKDFDIISQHLCQVIRDNNITRKRTCHEHYPKERYGKPEETIVIFGNWEQKQHMKYKEPIKGKGMRMLFRQNNYKTFLVDEFRTSCMCSVCKEETGRCEKFQIRTNPKPYKSGNVLVHGLISCKNCSNVWNRDVNGATNIYRIAKNAIKGIERPKYLCREKKEENIKVEKPKKEKVKKVVQNKVTKSVKVDALTKS